MALSREYYAVAPYHHDSAASRMYAVKLSETRRTAGLGAALREVLATRDSLEPTVRLLVAPASLHWLRGHLVSCVPLLALFLTLVAGLVWERSGSPLLAAVATLLLPCFAYVHDPVGGFADYWRESSATWLLGSAVACWFGSDDLRRRGWGTACGALLAALVLTRTVAGIYGALVLAPLVARVLPHVLGARADAVRRGRLLRLAALAAAGAAVTALLVGGKLYVYYLVTGWSYGASRDVLAYVGPQVPSRAGLGLLVVAAAVAVARILRREELPGRFWFDAAWLVAAIPLVVAVTGALYHGTFALATPLCVLAGALALAALRGTRPAVALGLLAIAVAASAAELALVRRHARAVAAEAAPTRRFYQDLTGSLLGRDPAVRYGLLFDAVDTIFVNTAFFDHGVWPTGTVSYHTVMDTYYRQHFPGLDAPGAARRNLEAVNSRVGTRAAAFCTPADVARNLPAQPFAREAGTLASAFLRADPRWKALRRFDAPVGCVMLYERVASDLTAAEKWAAVADPVLSGP
ncbi:MAG: hypothetical protein ABW221_07160 [Vicinamibacteria bacterium]